MKSWGSLSSGFRFVLVSRISCHCVPGYTDERNASRSNGDRNFPMFAARKALFDGITLTWAGTSLDQGWGAQSALPP
jgi:hypothetical protein